MLHCGGEGFMKTRTVRTVRYELAILLRILPPIVVRNELLQGCLEWVGKSLDKKGA